MAVIGDEDGLIGGNFSAVPQIGGATLQVERGGSDVDLVGGLSDVVPGGGQLPAQARPGGIDALRVFQVLAAELADGDGGEELGGGNELEQECDTGLFEGNHGGGEF